MRSSSSDTRGAEAGISLVEVLVVLAVIGIAAGATLLGLNALDRDNRAETEAVRLARHLSLGVDEALISGRDHALLWDASGYAFQRRAGPGWVAATIPALAARHELRAPTTMQRLDGETGPVRIPASATGPQLVFGIVGSGTSWVVTFDGFSATALPEDTFRAGGQS